jgi:hypothetical protein
MCYSCILTPTQSQQRLFCLSFQYVVQTLQQLCKYLTFERVLVLPLACGKLCAHNRLVHTRSKHCKSRHSEVSRVSEHLRYSQRVRFCWENHQVGQRVSEMPRRVPLHRSSPSVFSDPASQSAKILILGLTEASEKYSDL